MAPRARIAAYKALWSNEDGSQSSGFTVDLVAAIDQAVADGVDVINYSVSGSTTSMNTAVGISFLFAADAGVFVAASAGNNGPGASTVAHNNPWLTTVAAGTHDRYYAGTVTLGDDSTYDGASIDSNGAGPADLVYAGAAGDALCAIDSLDPAVVTGKIVVCDRGIYARVDKSYAVMEAGGIGMVLANVVAQLDQRRSALRTDGARRRRRRCGHSGLCPDGRGDGDANRRRVPIRRSTGSSSVLSREARRLPVQATC